MIIAQVSLRLSTIKGLSKMLYHPAQCRLQLACWLQECHLQWHIREFLTPSNWTDDCRPGVTTRARSSTSSLLTSKRPATRLLLQQSVCVTKEFLHRLPESSSESSSHTVGRCSVHGFHQTGQRRTACMASCGWTVCCGPWRCWGNGTGRCMV